ncbi:MAG TPA: BTAD domain-containing putative transcriptional regulator [Candidatus Dormibacteraeota bacterium]|nr:BTAD domain-containing putative transcriptional regulator [Candidatus Dormibacteraeota bacterium]
MARCQVKVLGGFEVWVDGAAVPAAAWRTRRAADVVKLLALEHVHAMHREQLLDLLWPELGEEAGGANLRKAIHYARRAMGAPESVGTDGGMVQLWNGDVEVDADHFMQLLSSAVLTNDVADFSAAADAYPGDALPADRYEPWAQEPRERLRSRYLQALKGAQQWERLLEIDPTDEESHRALMRLHFENGRRREALRQFEQMREALREYIGVGPDRETIALYEQVLKMEGGEPPTPAQRAAQLIATGLVALNQGDLGGAEQLARDARDIALAANLRHEVGDASTLLALASMWSGSWQRTFESDFVESLRQSREVAEGLFEAHLCFAEYYMSGTGTYAADEYARHLLSLADAAGSGRGKGVAQLMLGEALLHAGRYDAAHAELLRAYDLIRDDGTLCGISLALEHIAEVEVAMSRRSTARTRLRDALAAAQRSSLPSHMVVRVLGVKVAAAEDPRGAVGAVDEAERMLADANRVCDPCSINFHVQATAACARTGDMVRARRHLAEAERISGLWRGGPWAAAVWEARAAVRLAEGERAQADALLREAADAFADAQRPVDAARCLAGAAAVA